MQNKGKRIKRRGEERRGSEDKKSKDQENMRSDSILWEGSKSRVGLYSNTLFRNADMRNKGGMVKISIRNVWHNKVKQDRKKQATMENSVPQDGPQLN